jgi:NAD(P)-dependent dehydrogenase (short-subunit alcohol dehydrogenase family)
MAPVFQTARDDQRRVLITGAGSGIGRHLAHAFAERGADVVLLDRDAASVKEAAAEIPGSTAVVVDITDDDALARTFTELHELGGLDVVVNNATVCTTGSLLELPVADLRADLEVNLLGPMLVSRHALPAMIAQGRGAIINVASVNAMMHLGNEAYSAAKAGVLALTRSIATEYGPFGVRCNAVAPGTVDSPQWDARRHRDPQIMQTLQSWYPLGRIGTAQDVADAVMFLASPQAAWINGTTLTVDGGLSAGNARMVQEIQGR